MAWYYGKFSCGHEGKVNVVGKQKDRQWKIDRLFSERCPECYDKYISEKRAKENEEALNEAKEMDLVSLTGSEKQVAWAITLRKKFIEEINRIVEKYAEIVKKRKDSNEKLNKERAKKGKELRIFTDEEFESKAYYEVNGVEYNNKFLSIDDILRTTDYIIKEKDSAEFYIRSRYLTAIQLIEKYHKTESEIEEVALEKEIIKEGTIFPIEARSNDVAEISVVDNTISIKYIKDDGFREIVKSLGFEWQNSLWERELTKFNGKIEDRVSELGNKLLVNNYPISILNKEIRENAVNGKFEHECTRWILKNNDKLAIKWKGKNDTLYSAARRISGSRWMSPYVVVDIKNYTIVEEFAELYGFKFTDKAKNLIEQYKEELKKVEIVNPVKVEKKKEKDGFQDILKSSREIISDLIEE